MQTLIFNKFIDKSQDLYQHHTVDMTWHQSYYQPTPWLPKHISMDMVKEDHLGSYLKQATKFQYICQALDNHAIHWIIRCGSRFLPSNSPVIVHLTTITKLAIATEKAKLKLLLPSEYTPYASVFLKEATDYVPPSRPYDHEINLNKTFKPKIGKVYSISPEEQKATEDFLDKNLRTGKIHPSNSPQASPFFFVKKKDGGLCPCQDYCYVNKHIVHDTYPLPLISDLIDKLQGAKIFTKFDICWEYNNVRIKDGHQWKAAFVTHKGLFKPTVMFFGLTNSPATFQQFINDSFCDMIAERWLVSYMDDLLLYSSNTATHTEQTKRVLQCMVELDLHLKLEKCTFAISKVEYLGMIVKPGQLAMDPIKLNSIAQWPTPSKVKDICSFLGFTNFYWQFIPNYSTIACPLIDLTKKNLPWNWTPSQQQAFDHLKCLFLSKPVLHIPNLSSLFANATNVSKYASGAILLQTDSNGEWHPYLYLSQSFSPAEQNYDIYDWELLAVICALKAWRHYLHGSPFPIQVFIDHKNLTYFCKPQVLNHCQACWLLDLVDFNLTIIHVPGSQLAGPDALSRRPDLLPSTTPENEGVTLLPPSLFVNLIDMSLSHHVQSSSASNPLVLQALQSMDGSIHPAFHSHLSDWQYAEGILIYKGHVYILLQLVLFFQRT